MAEEKRLRLKRRRMAAPEPPVPTRTPQTARPGARAPQFPPRASSTWLGHTDVNQTDRVWALLMKTVSSDTKLTAWQTVPDLPQSTAKAPAMSEYVGTETFSAGSRLFTWLPFPPSCDAMTVRLDRKPRRKTAGGSGDAGTRQGWPPPAQPPAIQRQTPVPEREGEEAVSTQAAAGLGVAQESHGRWAKCYTGNVRSEDVFGAEPRQHAAKYKKRSPAKERHGRGHMSSDVVDGPNPPPQRNTGRPGSDPEVQSDLPTGHREAKRQQVSPRRTLRAAEDEDDSDIIIVESQDSPFTENGQHGTGQTAAGDSVTKVWSDGPKGSLTLRSCPMCLAHFPAGCSQLEVDCHLAKCLSESTEDVMW
ncbi:uncharacterized protein si:ch73-70k4.1 [Callorhinchus milii]|uniref:uncharacterized protein si:ch73-70k4.1 n=1 Tax=Callorhinchus milii TaxID=7868 RepID=UPI001C3FED34|nr:uncharacterized protein si:ch73-70k4.1 [Callorhinchus milii]